MFSEFSLPFKVRLLSKKIKTFRLPNIHTRWWFRKAIVLIVFANTSLHVLTSASITGSDNKFFSFKTHNILCLIKKFMVKILKSTLLFS